MEAQAKKLGKKIKNADLTLDDFLDQMQQMKNMGSMDDILAMLPGANKLKGLTMDEKQIKRTEAIVQSMTKQERNNPNVINGARRKRIAAGSGTSVQEVNRLLNQFDQMKKMLKSMTNQKGRNKRGIPGLPF